MSIPQRTGITNLPLHGGKAPAWLFGRMSKLAREITVAIVSEFGPQEMLNRLSDPFWFQAFGCVLGFDWHSSGITTTVCGALKDGIQDSLQAELGIFIAGGKGRTSRKTPSDIINHSEKLSVNPDPLVYASKMSAKVDNTALQDGYQLYHHSFFFTADSSWAVVQQGMNETNNFARRYHWLGKQVTDFVCEPHNAICSDGKPEVLNFIAAESHPARSIITKIAAEEKPEKLVAQLKKLQTLNLPVRHHLELNDINPDRLMKIFLYTYEQQPQNFENLLSLAGLGPSSPGWPSMPWSAGWPR